MRKKIVSAIAALGVIEVLGGAVKTAKENSYYVNMNATVNTMLDGAVKAENTGNLIVSVWSNAINRKNDEETDKYTLNNGKFVDDFNEALDKLFTDEEFDKNISDIRSNQSKVITMMRRLENPPKKYEEAYSDLKDYYDEYRKLTRVIVNHTGSLNSFSEEFGEYDESSADAYDKMKLYLEQ